METNIDCRSFDLAPNFIEPIRWNIGMQNAIQCQVQRCFNDHRGRVRVHLNVK